MSAHPLELNTACVTVSSQTAWRLRIFNAVIGVLHLVSGSAMLALSNDFSLPLSTFTFNGPPGTPV